MTPRKLPASTPSSILGQRAEAWFDAVCERHSRRAFNQHPVGEDELKAIAHICETYRPFDDARVALVAQPSLDVFKGIVGGYGKVTGAPHVLVVLAKEGPAPAAAQAHAGYTGEAVVLEAASRALATCWIGGFFDRAGVGRILEIHEGERVVAVSPLGHAAASETFVVQAMSSMSRSSKRKPLEQIAQDAAGWPTWALAAAECARLAPSAVNRQPWRFRFEDGALVIGRDNAREVPHVTKALDCGIAMLHAELGAHSAGARGEWEWCEDGLDLARFAPVVE